VPGDSLEQISRVGIRRFDELDAGVDSRDTGPSLEQPDLRVVETGRLERSSWLMQERCLAILRLRPICSEMVTGPALTGGELEERS
jgi:hypothetical protein